MNASQLIDFAERTGYSLKDIRDAVYECLSNNIGDSVYWSKTLKSINSLLL